MNYYKTYDTWQNFFEYVKQNLDGFNKSDIGFMYRPTADEQDIYIATVDDRALEVIKKQYELHICDQPTNFLDNNWNYTGNNNLFETKL